MAKQSTYQKSNVQKSGKSQAASKSKTPKVKWEFPLEKKNYMVLAIGIGVIILGYLLMATGITEQPAVTDGKWNNVLAIHVAPIVLVIGYLIIIPYGLIKLFKKNEDKDNKDKIDSPIS